MVTPQEIVLYSKAKDFRAFGWFNPFAFFIHSLKKDIFSIISN